AQHIFADSPEAIDALHDQMDNGLRGVLLASFMDRSPESSLAKMLVRTKMHSVKPPALYSIEDQTFVLYVPKDYDPRQKYGLVVYISNIPAFVPPKDWQQVLTDRKLIMISANNADQNKSVYQRMGLAMDAMYNASLRYSIVSDRTYIAGMHSGADLASVLAIHYPQQFAGGLFMHSCFFYRDIPSTPTDQTQVRAGYRRPMMGKLYRAKSNNRYVLLGGEKASNFPELKAIYDRGFVEDRFKQVQLLVMPKRNTTRPDGTWFGNAIDALDRISDPEAME
ncbi:hypothetical protein JYU15_02450, partial [bacterium AH-315-I18]|nr:hypothetical protein [bacterium AH-315-I18]